jgi:CheY-like chemotaxis protein
MVTTVLIIEDNQDHRLLIQRILSRINLDFMIAGNTQEIDRFLERVDLIILDMNLSEKWLMSSSEIIAYIRNHHLFKALPILALTTTRSLFERKPRAGWDILMMKPFDIAELQQNILRLVG